MFLLCLADARTVGRVPRAKMNRANSGAVAEGPGAMAPPGKNLSDNFDACRKFLKFLFVKFKKCSFHKYSVL